MILAVVILMISCGNTVIKRGENTHQTEKISISDTLSNYAADWQAFKKAAASKNKTVLKPYVTDNITDFDGLFFMLNDLFVRRKLDETPYIALENDTDFPSKNYKRFYAEDVGVDEFGYEYATAVTLYFLETTKGLKLDRYAAAG